MCLVSFVEKEKSCRCNASLQCKIAAFRRKEKKEKSWSVSHRGDMESRNRAHTHTALLRAYVLTCGSAPVWYFYRSIGWWRCCSACAPCRAETLGRVWSKSFIQLVPCLSRCWHTCLHFGWLLQGAEPGQPKWLSDALKVTSHDTLCTAFRSQNTVFENWR